MNPNPRAGGVVTAAPPAKAYDMNRVQSTTLFHPGDKEVGG